MEKTKLTVTATVNAPVATVWHAWNAEDAITQWNSPSPDWHSPRATIDLRDGGRFSIRMEAKDGSMGFDFSGTYDKVIEHESIEYTMDDDRKCWITFTPQGEATYIHQVFEAESQNPPEFQQAGWQAILNSFKHHMEKNSL